MTSSLATYPSGAIRRLRVLGVIFDLAQKQTLEEVGVKAMTDQIETERDLGRLNLQDELELLKADGFVNFFKSLAGIGSAHVTALGANAAEEFELARNSLIERRARLRDVYLHWLYVQIEESDGAPTPEDFLAESPTFYGVQYTPKDLEKAGEWLKDSGFIGGQGAWQYPAPLRPTLTQMGIYTIENQRSVGDPPPSAGPTYNTTVHGSANVAQGNRDVQQTLVSNQTWVQQATDLADLLDQSLPALGASVRLKVAKNVAALRGELEKEPDVSRVRQIVTAISGFLSNSAAGALGGLLSAQVLQLLASLS